MNTSKALIIGHHKPNNQKSEKKRCGRVLYPTGKEVKDIELITALWELVKIPLVTISIIAGALSAILSRKGHR